MKTRASVSSIGPWRMLVCAIGLMLFSGMAMAQDSWQHRLSPYMWFAGIKGDAGTLPPLPAAPIELSASDALSDLDAGYMIMLDSRKGRHGFFMDLMYTDVQTDSVLVPSPINLNMRSISKTTIFTLAYQYEWYRKDQTVVDVMAGVRYWNLDSQLQFSGGLGILAGQTVSNTESWIDPAIGIKGRAPLGGSRFYFEGGAGVGGFGVGSDLFYDLSVNLGYQWTKSIGTAIGYRLFYVDYEKDDGYLYDVTQQGWQIGLTWAF